MVRLIQLNIFIQVKNVLNWICSFIVLEKPILHNRNIYPNTFSATDTHMHLLCYRHVVVVCVYVVNADRQLSQQ